MKIVNRICLQYQQKSFMNKKVFTLWFFNYKNYLKGNTIFKYKFYTISILKTIWNIGKNYFESKF